MLGRTRATAAIFLLLFLAFHLFPPSASAQGGIKVWPARVELTIGRDETVAQVVSVENQSDAAIRMCVYVMDFRIGKENDFVFLEPGEESYSCSRWLSIGETDFELAPGENKAVAVTISVPQDVEPGGHYAALLFETVQPQPDQGFSVTINSRIASLFYLTIPGVTEADVVAKAEIVSLSFPGWAVGGPVKIAVLVRNTGNVHLDIATKAYLYGLWGRKVGELDLGQTVILPGSERIVEGNWEKTPFLDRVKANIMIGYFDEHGELVNQSKTKTLWVTPSGEMVAAIVVPLALLPFLIWLLIRRYRLRIERK